MNSFLSGWNRLDIQSVVGGCLSWSVVEVFAGCVVTMIPWIISGLIMSVGFFSENKNSFKFAPHISVRRFSF